MSGLGAFDHNTSQYSNYDPVGAIENAGSKVGDYLSNAYHGLTSSTDRSVDNLRSGIDRTAGDFGSDIDRSYDDIRSSAGNYLDDLRDDAKRYYDDIRDDLRNVNRQDFYASDVDNSILRNSMQSPYLNSYLRINAPNVIPIQAPPIAPSSHNSHDYDILFIIVILLVLFVAWRCFVSK
ncbi:hypothetical protein QLL95_gp0765 [Cotonvirus japonicus]|uniref:Uncharacterized protein n=1 Tax=Cotonvirus japonicus TaxID=2811091 RepID=A0ABM7NT57_9VIRU|nr:hypothetical protein QLL95_gp0765 [Cotonvirus japonicus]BCS83358.1 hypothetical protein [Cotonvirus japonicus]